MDHVAALPDVPAEQSRTETRMGAGGAPAVVGRERAVIDRLQRLRIILPALAQEAATARREAARLRSENARLLRRLADLEARYGTMPSGRVQGASDVARE